MSTIWVMLCLLLATANVQSRPSVRAVWSTLLNRAMQLSRQARWNEFVEEGQLKQRLQQNKTIDPNHQSLIDETKDPSSPFYISMISSNIGGQSNRTSLNSVGVKGQTQPAQMTKLFSYDFSTLTPSRVMHTTKRPLITYINVSNLEEPDLVESPPKYNPALPEVANGQQLQLLNNNVDPGGMAAIKRRLPECANQQVCAAHYVKSNHTQRLCECSGDFNWNCDELSNNEEHIIDLSRKHEYKVQRNSLEVYTQVKLCENLRNIKLCKTPTDWTIMALQSERTGKAHYVVVCKCPDAASFEGPFTHKHPPYARFPGIRVYGMLCNQGIRKSKVPKGIEKSVESGNSPTSQSEYSNRKNFVALEIDQNSNEFPEFPWELAYAVINSTTLQGFW